MTTITVHKLDHNGDPVWQYEGRLLERDATTIKLEAYFNRDDVQTAYHRFRRGDRMVEYFYTDRWYNIFQMHDADDDHLKGWYCNITRPARFEADAIYADDLALDVMVYPDGRLLVLDADEFDALPLDDATRQQARAALDQLRALVAAGEGVFAGIQR